MRRLDIWLSVESLDDWFWVEHDGQRVVVAITAHV